MVASWPSVNCSGSTPMPIRLDRWIRSKEAASTARTPSRAVPLAAQSREDPEPYSWPAMISNATPSAAYRWAASKMVICSPPGLLVAHHRKSPN
jgi:hypothetical protein